MIKTDDMVKVLAEEILKLEEKLVYKAEINMRKLNELVNRLHNNSKNVPDVGLTNCKIEFLKDDMVKMKPVRHRLDVFYKILKIITSVRDLNKGKKK
jgi:predicted transcriptional regulator